MKLIFTHTQASITFCGQSAGVQTFTSTCSEKVIGHKKLPVCMSCNQVVVQICVAELSGDCVCAKSKNNCALCICVRGLECLHVMMDVFFIFISLFATVTELAKATSSSEWAVAGCDCCEEVGCRQAVFVCPETFRQIPKHSQ